MKKYVTLLAIPLAVTALDGCASFHNAVRNVRDSIQHTAHKKDPHYKKAIAHGFACEGSLERSIYVAKSEVRQELKSKGIDEAIIETIPNEPEPVYWPSVDFRMGCAIAVAYPIPAEPKNTPSEK